MESKHTKRKLPVSYHYTMTALYTIGLFTCFICNLAVQHTLSWFYIVFSAAALAYCITNLPFLVGKFKLLLPTVCASGMVFVLLWVCNWFVNGDWLLHFAYPVAFVSLLFIWCILLVSTFRRMGVLLKTSLIALIAGIAVITIHPMVNYLLEGTINFYDYIRPDYWPAYVIGNKISFYCCVLFFFVSLLISLYRKGKQRIRR